MITVNTPITETISVEADLISKLKPLADSEIFAFMDALRGGTYFNMGMYSPISVARAYKKTLRIYKVVTMTAIVSGVSYENIGTTKDFRDKTGDGPGKAWYDHVPGYENRIGAKKSDPTSKYILWDIKKCSGTCVYYYVVDISTGAVTPISKDEVLSSDYLTDSEKKKLMPVPVTGYDKDSGELVSNNTLWRTAAFDHVFWLSQEGKNPMEFGTKFVESLGLTETVGTDLFLDGNAHATANLDMILAGGLSEANSLKEAAGRFVIAAKPVVTADDKEFFDFDLEEFYFSKTDLAGASVYRSIGDARFYANNILSMSDMHRIYVLDAETLKELDSLDYYVDYEDEEAYPNYFDEGCAEKTEDDKPVLTESYRRIVSRGTTLADNPLFTNFE